MARVLLEFTDEFPDDGTLNGIKLKFEIKTDRSGEPTHVRHLSVTPAMLFATTIARLHDVGAIDALMRIVCRDLGASLTRTPAGGPDRMNAQDAIIVPPGAD